MTGISGTRADRVRVLLVEDEHTLTDVLPAAVTEAARRPQAAEEDREQPARRPDTSIPLTARNAGLHISSLRRGVGQGRAPMIHTGRVPGHAIRPTEDGR